MAVRCPPMSRVRRTRGTDRPAGSWATVAVPVIQFVLAGGVALLILVVALSLASRRVGEREAIVEARSEALIKAQGLVEPVLDDGLLDGDPDALDALDEVVRDAVLGDDLVRVKVWATDGTVLYSDAAAQIGEQYDLDEEELEAIDEGLVEAEVSDLSKPENEFERQEGKLLEVYLPLETPGGETVLFEAYFLYDSVEASGRRIWRSFAPIAIGALVLLELVQLPLAWSLARRLRVRQLEREELLNRAIAASEHERRRIAQDLHDGVVQDLAGVSYALAAMGRTPEGPAPADLEAAADTVRSSIEALRTLLVELYPPNLAEEGLGPALDDLLARSRAVGLEARCDLGDLPTDLPLPIAQLLYRTAQEALRNVIAHAEATQVVLTAGVADGRAHLEVRDDGRGIEGDPDAPAPAGHVGLVALRDLASDVGGSLDVSVPHDGGTLVRLEVPLP